MLNPNVAESSNIIPDHQFHHECISEQLLVVQTPGIVQTEQDNLTVLLRTRIDVGFPHLGAGAIIGLKEGAMVVVPKGAGYWRLKVSCMAYAKSSAPSESASAVSPFPESNISFYEFNSYSNFLCKSKEKKSIATHSIPHVPFIRLLTHTEEDDADSKFIPHVLSSKNIICIWSLFYGSGWPIQKNISLSGLSLYLQPAKLSEPGDKLENGWRH